MSTVFFCQSDYLENLEKALQKSSMERLSGKKVAVKLHMGEYGNLNYVRPPIAGLIVEKLKEQGAKPFLFDSITLYQRKRKNIENYLDTARRNGFTPETIGCPIVIGDSGKKLEGKLIPIEVCKEIAGADAMVVLSHGKAHPFSGFGGAIKNLGMGCVSKKTKKVEHDECRVVVDLEKCKTCKTCIPACPKDAMSVKENKLTIDLDLCFGCWKCIAKCPNNALSSLNFEASHVLADAALAVLKQFEKNNLLFVTMLLSIANECDCSNTAKAVMQDIGILVSENILAIDNAAIDLINREFGKDFFKELGMKNPKQQIEWLENQGYSTKNYELENP